MLTTKICSNGISWTCSEKSEQIHYSSIQLQSDLSEIFNASNVPANMVHFLESR